MATLRVPPIDWSTGDPPTGTVELLPRANFVLLPLIEKPGNHELMVPPELGSGGGGDGGAVGYAS